jgi:hypothetical protein
MSTTYSKFPLSGASNTTRQILVSGTTSGSATLIHSSVASITSASLDEVYLYAYNESTSSNQLSILWGGTTEPDDVTRYTIPSQNGRTLVVDGKLLYNGLSISAYAFSSNMITIDGFVNRITQVPDPTAIDPAVTNWSRTVVANGGATPSSNTLSALSVFYQTLSSTGLLNKMMMVNCVAPDSLIAACTPLIDIFRNSRVWQGSATLSGINGIYNNGGYIDTGFNPGTNFPTTGSAGITLYGYSIAGTSGYDFGMTDYSGVGSFMLNLNYGGNSSFQCFNVTTRLSITSRGNGYYSANRIADNDSRMYFANSTTTHTQIAISTSSSCGPTLSINYYHSYLGCIYITNSSGQYGGTTTVYSFVAVHSGLTQSESQILYNAVQTLRQSLGGGYI